MEPHLASWTDPLLTILFIRIFRLYQDHQSLPYRSPKYDLLCLAGVTLLIDREPDNRRNIADLADLWSILRR